MQNALAERRAHARIDFDAPVSITQGDKTYLGQLHDISLKGALIKTPENWDLPIGTACTLELALTELEPILMHTIVTRVEDALLGLCCDSIDLDSISRLRRLVELNLGDDSLLERELEALTHVNSAGV